MTCFRARAAEALGCKSDPAAPRRARAFPPFVTLLCPDVARSRSTRLKWGASGARGRHTCSISISVPAKSFGCKNRTGLPWAPIFGLAVAEHARALGFELVARGDDVFDLVAEMMHAAFWIALQEFGDRRVRAERMQQARSSCWAVRRTPPSRRDRARALGPRRARRAFRDRSLAAFSRSGTAMATWFSFPIILSSIEMAGRRGTAAERAPTTNSQRRGSRRRIRSKPCLIAAKRASIRGSNSTSVKMYGQSFSMPSRTSSPT